MFKIKKIYIANSSFISASLCANTKFRVCASLQIHLKREEEIACKDSNKVVVSDVNEPLNIGIACIKRQLRIFDNMLNKDLNQFQFCVKLSNSCEKCEVIEY